MSIIDEKTLRRQQKANDRKVMMEQKKQEYEQNIRYKTRLTENLNFKQYILVKNILVLIFTFSIVYAMISLMQNYKFNVYAFIASRDFVGVIIVVILVWVLWAMLQGKEFKAPEGQNNPFSEGNKTQLNMPNPMQPQQQRPLNMPNPFGQKLQQPEQYQHQEQKPHLQNIQQYRQPKQTKPTGSWFCSHCNKLNMNTVTCRFCGAKK